MRDETRAVSAVRWSALRRLLWIAGPPLTLTLLPALLVHAQARQVRYEELAEAVRGPFWLAQAAVFDGASTNVGWYGFLLLVYNLFGFGMETARWARVALFGVAALALSVLLHRWLRPLPAVALLATIAASPTLLHLNRITTSYGTDLLILPLCLLALDVLWRRARLPAAQRGAIGWSAVVGCLVMWGATTYPAFVPAIPALGVWLWLALPRARRAVHVAAALAGLALPLVAATLALREPASLFWDPVERAGIFRGGGGGWVDGPTFLANLGVVARDLFASGSSYYFDVRAIEFGGIAGRSGFVAVLALAAAAAWRAPETRRVIATAVAAGVLGLSVTSAAAGPPGLRRSTVVLAAFYAAAAIAWLAAPRLARHPRTRAAIVGALLLLPLHHALAFRVELERARRPAARGRERVWFAVGRPPQQALEHWVAHTEAGHALDCREMRTPRKQTCRYDYIYAAVAGARAWNGKPEVEIRAVDPRTGEPILLDVEGWRKRAPPPTSNRRPRRPAVTTRIGP